MSVISDILAPCFILLSPNPYYCLYIYSNLRYTWADKVIHSMLEQKMGYHINHWLKQVLTNDAWPPSLLNSRKKHQQSTLNFYYKTYNVKFRNKTALALSEILLMIVAPNHILSCVTIYAKENDTNIHIYKEVIPHNGHWSRHDLHSVVSKKSGEQLVMWPASQLMHAYFSFNEKS